MGTDSPPSNSVDRVTVNGDGFRVIREGLADILVPIVASDVAPKKTSAGGEEQSVFYNPIQQFNRDLSVLAIKVHAQDVIAIRNLKRAARAQKESIKFASASSAKRKREEDRPSSTGEEQHAKKAKTVNDALPTGHTENNKSTVITNVQAESADESLGENKTHGHDQNPEPSPRDPPRSTQFRILDALSATGLRALRYAKEIPEATLITANDLSSAAVKSIKRNVEYNRVKSKVYPHIGNAAGHMYYVATESSAKLPDGGFGKYDVVDLDPYGTAAPFLDAAVQAVNDGGLLCVTCTDSAIFASMGYLEKTYSQYGGIPWRGQHSHEAGLRLIVHAVATSAARYGLAIEPVLSLSIDYYTRAFIRIRKSPQEVKFLAGKTMTAFNCDHGCGAWTRQLHVRTQTQRNSSGERMFKFTAGAGPTAAPFCEHCGFKTHVVGPMWGGPLHNPFFVQRMLDRVPELDRDVYGTIPRLEGMLNLALHETLLPPDQGQVKIGAAGPTMKEDQTSTPQSLSTSNGIGIPAKTSESYVPIERLDSSMPDPHPFFLLPADLSRALRCSQPSDASVRGALLGLGYRVTRSHTRAGSIRTDAPWSVVWDVMRAWIKQKAPVKEGAYKPGMAAHGLWKQERDEKVKELEGRLKDVLRDHKKVTAAMGMIEVLLNSDGADGGNVTAEQSRDGTVSKENETPQIQDMLTTAADGEKKAIVFDERLGRDQDRGKMVRYQENPRENWGPQSRAR